MRSSRTRRNIIATSSTWPRDTCASFVPLASAFQTLCTLLGAARHGKTGDDDKRTHMALSDGRDCLFMQKPGYKQEMQLAAIITRSNPITHTHSRTRAYKRESERCIKYVYNHPMTRTRNATLCAHLRASGFAASCVSPVASSVSHPSWAFD